MMGRLDVKSTCFERENKELMALRASKSNVGSKEAPSNAIDPMLCQCDRLMPEKLVDDYVCISAKRLRVGQDKCLMM